VKKILVVDDEVQAVRLLKKFLGSKAYEVYTATNAWEALQQIRVVDPDLVLLDLIMPDMNGLDALKEIKKTNPEIAVMIVTALCDEELAKKALQWGADDYITKPFDLDDMADKVLVHMIQPPVNPKEGVEQHASKEDSCNRR